MSTEKIIATAVPEADRLDFLPDRFGIMDSVWYEGSTYATARMLSADYGGGLWDYYTLDNKGWFMAPVDSKSFAVSVEGNGYSGSLSPEAFGIVVTLFAMNGAMWNARLPSKRSRHLSNAYEALKDYAGQHPEAAEIFRAID